MSLALLKSNLNKVVRDRLVTEIAGGTFYSDEIKVALDEINRLESNRDKARGLLQQLSNPDITIQKADIAYLFSLMKPKE